MQSTLFALVSVAERLLRIVGLDVFTTLDDSGAGPFAFETRDHGAAGREYWGLGLHVTVSPMRRAA